MSLPVFSKTGVPSVTMSVGPAWPYTPRWRPAQRIGRNDNRTVQVATLGPEDLFVYLRFLDAPQADYDALLAFLRHPLLNWHAASFTYTDHTGTSYTARLWGEDFAPSLNAPDSWDIELDLLLEPEA